MTTRGDHAEDDVKRLRRCIDDLVSLLALPPVSIDGDPSGVASTIARQLNERVVQRTRELAAVNEELKHEIAKHRRQEVALRDSEASSRLIVDSIPGPVALFTPAGEVEFVNRQIVEYFGRAFEELKHWETGGTTHPEDLPRAIELFTRSIASGDPFEFEIRARRFDGVYRWFQSRGFPLRDTDGKIVRWCNLLVDIDERKCAEEALRKSEAQLKEARRELQLTVDTIPAKVATYEPDGTRSFVNQQWRKYVDFTVEEATGAGRRIARHFHPDDSERAERAWRNSSATGEPLSVDLRIRRADGEYRWHTHRCVPLCDEQGTIVKWYAAEVDIEDKKRAEEALRQREAELAETERELRLTLDSIPTITWRAGPNGYVQHLNKRWFDYTGTTPEQVHGWRWKLCVHPDDLERLVEIGNEYVTSGMPVDGEARLRCHDGTYRWFLFRPAPARDETGKVVAWYGTITDIEDRKRAEDALQRSEAELADAKRALQQTIDTIPITVARYSADGRHEFVNAAWKRYTGLSEEAALGSQWSIVTHPDDIAEGERQWREARATEQPVHTEARYLRADGQYRWLSVNRVPFHDEDGKVTKWFSVSYDIEDRKQAEQELRRSEAFLAEGQRLSSTGTFSWRLETDQLTFTDELYCIFELDQQAGITFERVNARIHPEDVPVLAARMAQIRAGRVPADQGIRLRMPDDRIKYLRTMGRLVRHPDGRSEYLGAFQDVTQHRLAEQAADKVRSELAHVTRVMSLGALTASIAHEVNQPLAGIITNAGTCLRMLAADPPNIEGARETARRTIRDGNRAADVITRLRALFSNKAAAAETLDLNEAIREVLSLAFSDLLRNRVILRVEIDEDRPLLVTGDRTQLQQVILNLVRNASDAMREVNDRPRHLVVRSDDAEEGHVRLIVKDAGVGLEQGADRLFDAFYTTKDDGMGIGLAVSRTIIERHGGRLWAEPNDGPGATFTFSIPRQTTSAGDDGTGGAIWTRPTRGAHDLMRNS